MEQQEDDDLDTEFEKYLEALKRCITDALEEVSVIELLNQWIDKLSHCQDDEKELRNSYLVAICNQVSRGYLQREFLTGPPSDKLPPLPPLEKNIDSGENTNLSSNENEFYNNDEMLIIDERDETFDIHKTVTRSAHSEHTFDTKYPFSNQEFFVYNCQSVNKFPFQDKNYQKRVNHVIVKLKELKQENALLRNEICKLKASIAESDDGVCPSLEAIIQRNVARANKGTQECIEVDNAGDSNLKEIEELKEANQQLLLTVDNLNRTVHQVTEEKNNELNDVREQYKNHVNILKVAIQDELKQAYERDIEKIKTLYKTELKEMQDKVTNDFRDLIFIKDNMLNTKGQLIDEKDKEIALLRTQINELQNKLTTIQAATKEDHNIKKDLEFYKAKAEQLEKAVAKVEKLKQKTIKSYETKLSFLQKDRHYTECSLQLQLVKQRSQVIGDMTEANQHEVNDSINKLESKYKDIVANMQATAIQRRLQDQMALETILHAACGRNHNDNYQTTSGTNNKFVRKTVRMENRNNFDIGNRNLQFDKANNSSSFDSDGPGFCLRNEDLCDMIDKVFIPQKDTCDNVPRNK